MSFSYFLLRKFTARSIANKKKIIELIIENLYLFFNLDYKHLLVCVTIKGTRIEAVIQHGGQFSSNTSKVTTAFIMKMELIFWKETITFHYGKWNT